jgi:AcrR family transcriptional regulator
MSTDDGRRDRDATRMRLIRAVGTLLAKQGFTSLGINAVAREAGVDKVLIYRYFGGLPELIEAYGLEGDFWPSTAELVGDREAFSALPLADRLSLFARRFAEALRKRPVTLEILAWEMVETNHLTRSLETLRERQMVKIFKDVFQEGDREFDLPAFSALVGAGLSYLATRSRHIRWYNGIDLHSEQGWERLFSAVDAMIRVMVP